MEEGCLSFPEIYGIVNRSASIKVRFNDITGAEHTAVFSGKKAAIILHEIDHFNGVSQMFRCFLLPDAFFLCDLTGLADRSNEARN